MIELSEGEVTLIEQIRKVDWGKIELVIQSGKLVMMSVKKDIKLEISLTSKK